MRTIKQDTILRSRNAKGYRWKLIALFIPVGVIALMLMSVLLIKDKVAMKHYVSNSYRAGDVALFVAMPLLNAAVK